VPHFGLARFTVVLRVARGEMLFVRCICRRVHLLLLLKVVVIVLLNTRLRFSICSARRNNGLVRHLLSMVTVAIVLDVDIIVHVV
jgi:hypothetical protein